MRFIPPDSRKYSYGQERNEHILEELQVEPVTTYRQQYRAQWKSHTEWMTDTK
jgi:hypothetical protein